MANGTVFSVGCIKKAKQMADSLSLLPDLELYLFDDSEVKTDDIVSEDVFFSVQLTCEGI